MEKRFDLGLQRMQQCPYPLMACFTVNRINTMHLLQYQHLQCSIQRDPYGGPPRILLEIKYEFAKKYMGVTQANTFPLPEIIYDPSLMLSPHTFLLGILFHNNAFRAPGTKSMEDLRRFTLSRQLKIFGKIAGFKWSLFTHRFRYGSGTILNESGLISDAKQNLIMKHANIRTFLNHYLPRRINTDMQALIRGLKPDTAMMRAVTRIGRWIDRRRPRELTDTQKTTVEHDPELQKAIRKRDTFSKKLQRSQKKTGRKLNKLDKLKWEEFDEEQAVLDIKRQLADTAILDKEAKEQLQIKE
ncbi:putative C2H2 finger domain protein [Aspergillus nomiae NRRL 13137]|uniref:Putative C2H2 finger domain protein n=1 Tax=Aspergillus nomiae NRRL (strain ATCC 15546 / NRRL 13137 / CBS 260.88 / M93) TaxID=1509407 RepID=A0A0L1IL88_ASPN3|nr:putative C2H2 finger domain protein [Aspergillus nomiae NRRL 13137]KNG80287.1 putative C2H2 finger domain protein [Aspergillus nomiae NRRL 13137]